MAKLTLSFKDRILKIFPLGKEEIVIGRDPDCGVWIDSLAIQPHHASVSLHDGQFQLRTLVQADPPTIDGEAVAEHRLQDGDTIRIGKHTLSFSADAKADDTDTLADTVAARALPTGWLQIMSGSHLGRTIRLDRAMTRLGKSGGTTAVIARREDGFYLSHLEGEQQPSVNDDPVEHRSVLLREGDRIRIDQLELHFFGDGEEHSSASESQADQHQRRFTRIPFDTKVTLQHGGKSWPAQLLDLSLKGALVERPRDWPDQIEGLIELCLHLNAEVEIRMDAQVVHVENEQLGLACKDIDLDSITHLRRLVELNLGDATLLERDLAALG